jgi:hypothetical protein
MPVGRRMMTLLQQPIEWLREAIIKRAKSKALSTHYLLGGLRSLVNVSSTGIETRSCSKRARA